MEIKDISHPISDELEQVREATKSQFTQGDYDKDIFLDPFDHFFRSSGKQLRPALVLLSANSVSGKKVFTTAQSVQVAVAVELIHSASLIHDDIIDDAQKRRGQATIHQVYNTKLAVLTGDLMFARAFAILSHDLPQTLIGILSQCVERMCLGEINKYGKTIASFSEYIDFIIDKTARFMSVCCQCGGELAGADTESIASLKQFGLNFGISYQLFDDFADGDAHLSFDIDLLERAVDYAERAKVSIVSLEKTRYKKGLQGLLDYLIEKNVQAEMPSM